MSYSPAPEHMDVPPTYGWAIVNTLDYLLKHPPCAILPTCEWIAVCKDTLMEMAKDPSMRKPMQSWIKVLATALGQRTGLKVSHCESMLRNMVS